LRFQDPSKVLSLIELLDQELANATDDHAILRMEILKRDLLQELGRSVLSDENMSESHDKAFLLSYYQSRPEFYSKSFVLSIHISDGDYAMARQALSMISGETTNESNYLEVQYIYIDYLESGFDNVSQISINRLGQIGQQAGPINGYARSVYYLVTGEKLDLNIPDYNLDSREREYTSGRKISCYPNPVKSILNVEISEVKKNDYDLTLSNMEGTIVLEEKFLSNEIVALNISDLSSGIYVIQITSANSVVIHIEKVVILNE